MEINFIKSIRRVNGPANTHFTLAEMIFQNVHSLYRVPGGSKSHQGKVFSYNHRGRDWRRSECPFQLVMSRQLYKKNIPKFLQHSGRANRAQRRLTLLHVPLAYLLPALHSYLLILGPLQSWKLGITSQKNLLQSGNHQHSIFPV